VAVNPVTLGDRDSYLNLGRLGNRATHLLYHSRGLDGSSDLMNKVLSDVYDQNRALEFVERWDGTRLTFLVSLPVVASLAFIGVWIVVKVHLDGEDLQVTMQTAFTVASYIVTTSKRTHPN